MPLHWPNNELVVETESISKNDCDSFKTLWGFKAHPLVEHFNNFNVENARRNKFIVIQISETCLEKSEAYKEDYKNICEIGKERIRRSGDKIKAEHLLAEKILTSVSVYLN